MLNMGWSCWFDRHYAIFKLIDMPDIKVDIRTNIPTITLILYLSSNDNSVLWDN